MEREPITRDAAQHVPVLIIGAGPTGLTLANLLGVLGARALIVERSASTVSEPRAVSIDDESLRTLQAIGLSDVVLQSIVPGYGSDYLTPEGRCFLTVEPSGRPYGFPRRNAFRQPQLEAQLRAGVNRFPNIEAMFGWSLEAFEQDDTGVTARLSGPQGTIRTVRCDYLVGCDGASSNVRRQLGIRLDGRSFAQRWLIVDLENSPVDRRNTVVFCDSTRPCIALPGPNLTRRFEFKLQPEESEEDMLRPDVVDKLLRDHGADERSALVRKVVYTFHARVAQRWSVGRVFLGGDAAHLTPPFAGQGMNSGLRDSSNLAWKLAMVTAGRMPAGLLTTYEEERRNHVWQMIRLALRMGRIMSPKSRLRGWIVQHALLATGLWPAAKSFFGEMKYKPKPQFDTGFRQADRLGKQRTMVGRMLPQPLVVTSDEKQVLLDDLLGCGFALLSIEVPVADLSRAAKAPVFEPLAPRCIAINPPVRSDDDSVTVVTVGDYLPEFERYRGRILLVRPDRYVATSGCSGGNESINVAMTALLARLHQA